MIPNTMLAWVLNSPGVLQLKEVEVPRIREDQVLIEIDRACICNCLLYTSPSPRDA